MILFIFEGAKYEPALYEGIKNLFFREVKVKFCALFVVVYTLSTSV